MSREPQLVLAFDTSSQVTSVAVSRGDQLLASDHTLTEARHAEVLLSKVQRCLADAAVTLPDLDLIGVGAGPGSFTGVRVGIATAKGLGLALGKPVIAVLSLEALALGLVNGAAGEPPALVAACLDAYKGELFAALYRRTASGLATVVAPFHAEPSRVAERLAAVSCGETLCLVGAGVQRYPELLAGLPETVRCAGAELGTPSAQLIATLARAACARGEIPALADVLPLYLRDSDAQLPSVPLRL